MAAVSVKGSIEQTHNYGVFAERRLDCMARFSLLSFYDCIPKLTIVTSNLHGNDFSVLLSFLQNPYGSLYYYCSYCYQSQQERLFENIGLYNFNQERIKGLISLIFAHR